MFYGILYMMVSMRWRIGGESHNQPLAYITKGNFRHWPLPSCDNTIRQENNMAVDIDGKRK